MFSEFNLRKPQKSYLPLDGPTHHKSDTMDAYWGSFLSSPVFFALVQIFVFAKSYNLFTFISIDNLPYPKFENYMFRFISNQIIENDLC